MSDQELFSGLKKGDEKCIRLIYSSLFPSVKRWVMDNSGNEADAYDIFQETLETILLKIDSLNSNMKGLTLRISKNKWLDKLRKTSRHQKATEQLKYLQQQEISSEEEQAIKEQLKYQLMEKYFTQLSDTCQQLLSLLKQGLKVEAIVKTLAFSNANTLYRRKAACMQRWSTLIKNDQEYLTQF